MAQGSRNASATVLFDTAARLGLKVPRTTLPGGHGMKYPLVIVQEVLREHPLIHIGIVFSIITTRLSVSSDFAGCIKAGLQSG